MEYHLGYSGEQTDGSWQKVDVWLEETDLANEAAARGIDWQRIASVQKLLFAECLADVMLTTALAKRGVLGPLKATELERVRNNLAITTKELKV